MKYYIWTIGCQMNKAESCGLARHLQLLGIEPVNTARDADIVILNTCVVRQNAEDKVRGMLGYVKGIKAKKPGMRIIVTGCFVGSETSGLKKLFPHVDYFFQPGLNTNFEDWLYSIYMISKPGEVPAIKQGGSPVSVYIPIIQGCNNYCSYCIVPFRRGRESSRPPEEILTEASQHVASGAREIVLLGQNVNAYGHDLDPRTGLSELLIQLHELKDLLRIRFLTNHPKDMSTSLIKALASLPKVCQHVCLPLQAGDDQILRKMNRHYSYGDFQALIRQMRQTIPGIAITTDLIVGFPGETEEQFINTRRAVEELRFDAVHAAAYSPRAGTLASQEFADDVPDQVKLQRLHTIEELQSKILCEINQGLVGTHVDILVEGKKGPKWYGRTYSDKLVFLLSEHDLTGKLVTVAVTRASPWSLQGIT